MKIKNSDESYDEDEEEEYSYYSSDHSSEFKETSDYDNSFNDNVKSSIQSRSARNNNYTNEKNKIMSTNISSHVKTKQESENKKDNSSDNIKIPSLLENSIKIAHWETLSTKYKEVILGLIKEFSTNPKHIFFRGRPPWEITNTSNFDPNEIDLFDKRLKKFSSLGIIGRYWGIFSMPFKGRAGYQLKTFFDKRLKEGKIHAHIINNNLDQKDSQPLSDKAENFIKSSFKRYITKFILSYYMSKITGLANLVPDANYKEIKSERKNCSQKMKKERELKDSYNINESPPVTTTKVYHEEMDTNRETPHISHKDAITNYKESSQERSKDEEEGTSSDKSYYNCLYYSNNGIIYNQSIKHVSTLNSIIDESIKANKPLVSEDDYSEIEKEYSMTEINNLATGYVDHSFPDFINLSMTEKKEALKTLILTSVDFRKIVPTQEILDHVKGKCTLYGALDPVTLKMIRTPAMDGFGNVLDFTTWMNIVHGNIENPYSKILVKESDIVIVDDDNWEDYKHLIRNIPI